MGNTPRIQLLPPDLIDQIAAGEVVERPASVVKELAENALDAGARFIQIDLEGGGRRLCRIVDDGGGMTPEEVTLAVARHATSKIHTAEDLFRLQTMGFRGEALASIAAVSRMVIVSRPATPPSIGAWRLEIDAGRLGEGRAAAAAPGTTIEVRDLLYNVPARLKFLKAEPTETAHASESVLRLALAHPAVHFRFRSSGRTLLDLPPHPTLQERAVVGLSRRGPTRLFATTGEEHGVHVTALLGAPPDAASTGRSTYLFVNRRFVRERSLLHAVVLGYGELLERGRYPLAVVHIDIAPSLVDVNVHPQKIEVRFANSAQVYDAVRHQVAAACARAPWLAESRAAEKPLRVYSLPPLAAVPAKERPGTYTSRQRVEEALALFARMPLAEATAQPEQTALPATLITTESAPGITAAAPGSAEQGFFASLVYLGQLHRTYLVCQGDDELVLIDQHAAHERVAFERLRLAHRSRQLRTQRLLFPCVIELAPMLAAVASAEQATLLELGFEIECFGGNTIALKTVPETLSQTAPIEEVLLEMLQRLGTRGGHLESSEQSAGGPDVLDHVLATMACHSVVRAGDVLDIPRARALLDSMDGIDFRAHCPHGRPVLLRMSLGEIERRFGRA